MCKGFLEEVVQQLEDGAKLRKGRLPELEIDRAHYLWGCFHLLWSFFIYGLGVCSEMVWPCGTKNQIAHTSSMIRSKMVCCCVIRHVRCTAQPRAYDVFRRCLSDVELSHGQVQELELG